MEKQQLLAAAARLRRLGTLSGSSGVQPARTIGDRESSILPSLGFLAVTGLASVLLLTLRATGFGALCLAMFLLGFAARRQAVRGGKGLSLSVDAPSRPLRVGESAGFSLRLNNDSRRPARRVEISYPVPPLPCARPLEGLEPGLRLAFGEEGRPEDLPVWLCRPGKLPGQSEAEIPLLWQAEKRGLLRCGDAAVRTGDDLGLTFSETHPPVKGETLLTVWPRRVPVKTEAFLQNLWDGQAGRRGYAEDPTLLRSVRDYREGDSARRLDKRMLARTGELMIREYETVLPCSLRFICDVNSFGPGEELEESISIMASLLEELCRRGIPCSLTLPAAGGDPVNLTEAPLEELLTALALLEEDKAQPLFPEELLSAPRPGERRWLFASSLRSLSAPAYFDRLAENGLTAVLKQPEGAEAFPGAVLAAESLLGGGKA